MARGNVKYPGTGEELRHAISGAGISVQRVEEKENLYVIRTDSGSTCTFVPSTRTVTVQGKPEEQAKLDAVVRKIVERRARREEKQAIAPNHVQGKRKRKRKKIFIVHGDDHVARDQLELVRELGLEPYVQARSGTDGLTIIEALERVIRPGGSAVTFGIVLLTPDDVGHARRAGGTGTKPRARQNVILEMGMLVGALGRKHVAVLKKAGELELPSDINGVLYAEFREHVSEVIPKLGQRLRGAGFDITGDAFLKASSR